MYPHSHSTALPVAGIGQVPSSAEPKELRLAPAAAEKRSGASTAVGTAQPSLRSLYLGTCLAWDCGMTSPDRADRGATGLDLAAAAHSR